MYNTTGNENFERVNIKKKGTKGKIETLSLRVNKLGSLISKDFCNYSYLFIVRVCVHVGMSSTRTCKRTTCRSQFALPMWVL